MRRARAEVRQAYGCPCGGPIERGERAGSPLAASVRGELDAIEAETGQRPTSCPWHAFWERDVIATVQAYDWHESGQLAEWWGDDPEWWLVEAVRFFHRTLASCLASVDRVRRSRPTAARPPLGQVVERVLG